MKPDYTPHSRRRGANLTDNKYAWHDHAACANQPDLYEAAANELDTKGGPKRAPNVTKAIALCNQCPVRETCLREALKVEVGKVGRWSIQGGLTPNERHALSRRAAA